MSWAAGEIARLRSADALQGLHDQRVQMSYCIEEQLNTAVSVGWMRTFAAEGFDLWISVLAE